MTEYPIIHLVKSIVKYDFFLLIEDCKYGEIIIPKGFYTDFATVPKILWWLIPPHCKAAMPAVVHDYTCQYAIWPRNKCDAVFMQLLKETKMPKWQYYTMFLFVRAFGWLRYGKFKQF